MLLLFLLFCFLFHFVLYLGPDCCYCLLSFQVVLCSLSVFRFHPFSLKALWDKMLELRFLLQKAFSSANRLPQVIEDQLTRFFLFLFISFGFCFVFSGKTDFGS